MNEASGRGRVVAVVAERAKEPTITDLLDEVQEILVSNRQRTNAKKAHESPLTLHFPVGSRLHADRRNVGVSRKIESDSDVTPAQLIQVLRAEEDVPSGGFIVRTAGHGISDKELREDGGICAHLLDIRAAAEKSKPRVLLSRSGLVQRIRAISFPTTCGYWVDSRKRTRASSSFNRIQPRMVKRVKLYTRGSRSLNTLAFKPNSTKRSSRRLLNPGGYL